MFSQILDHEYTQVSIVLLMVLCCVVGIANAFYSVEEGVEYKKNPAQGQHCVEISTSDMGTMWMCEKE